MRILLGVTLFIPVKLLLKKLNFGAGGVLLSKVYLSKVVRISRFTFYGKLYRASSMVRGALKYIVNCFNFVKLLGTEEVFRVGECWGRCAGKEGGSCLSLSNSRRQS